MRVAVSMALEVLSSRAMYVWLRAVREAQLGGQPRPHQGGIRLRHPNIQPKTAHVRHAKQFRSRVITGRDQLSDVRVPSGHDAVERGEDLLEAGQLPQPLHVGARAPAPGHRSRPPC